MYESYKLIKFIGTIISFLVLLWAANCFEQQQRPNCYERAQKIAASGMCTVAVVSTSWPHPGSIDVCVQDCAEESYWVCRVSESHEHFDTWKSLTVFSKVQFSLSEQRLDDESDEESSGAYLVPIPVAE